MRIAILQTDHIAEAVQDRFVDYPEMFQRVFARVDAELSWCAYDVQLALPENIDCDAYLITGSRHSVYDDLPWIGELVEFLRAAMEQGAKVVGICFGHQLMAHFFGGHTESADVGWGVGVHGQDVVKQQSWMRGEDQVTPATISLLCSHKDQVTEMPAGAELFLSSEFCPIAGFTMADQVITVQGHPEFTKEYSGALLEVRRDLLGESVYAAGKQSLAQPTDEELMARWIVNFLKQKEMA